MNYRDLSLHSDFEDKLNLGFWIFKNKKRQQQRKNGMQAIIFESMIGDDRFCIHYLFSSAIFFIVEFMSPFQYHSYLS
jgi:hypothetical protein